MRKIYETQNEFFEKKTNKNIKRMKKNASRAIRTAINDYRKHGYHKVAKIIRSTWNDLKFSDYYLYEKKIDGMGDVYFELLETRMITPYTNIKEL